MGHDPEYHTVLSNIAIVVSHVLDRKGLDGRAILEEVGIDFDFASNPDTRISVKQHQTLWRTAVQRTGDPCLGLVAGEVFQPVALHGLGLGWLASTSLETAFRRLVRFQRLISTNARVTLEETDRGFALVGGQHVRNDDFEPASGDAMMAILVRLCRITMGESLNPTRVCLAHGRGVCEARYQSYFRSEVAFDAPQYRLEFAREVVTGALPTANPQLARINDDVVIAYLARFDANDIVTRVRRQLIDNLVGGRPDQREVAQALNMSLRQLQRRLKDENSSFRQLTEGVRRELAERYLREKRRPIGEISFLLGFSEPANFTRSFKAWTGTTPGEFRDAA